MNDLDEYEKGYIAAMTEYAVWNDGVQYIGVLRQPLKAAIAEFLESRKALKENKQLQQRKEFEQAKIAGLRQLMEATSQDDVLIRRQLDFAIQDAQEELEKI